MLQHEAVRTPAAAARAGHVNTLREVTPLSQISRWPLATGRGRPLTPLRDAADTDTLSAQRCQKGNFLPISLFVKDENCPFSLNRFMY
ncbi:hypothetical protein GN956_G23302 [Arapaima gigas]